MIEQIIYWTGVIVLILLLLSAGIFLLRFCYIAYDYWLKKLLGWKELELRKDLFYFIKHKKEIREIIQDMKQGGKNNGKCT